MASTGGVQANTSTLTAAAADTCTMTGQGTSFAITHHGDVANPIYVRIDGSAAVAAADENFVILSGGTLVLPRVVGPNDLIISLISAGAATYTVMVL